MSFTSTSSTGATLYHCPCGPPVASTSYHKLPTLYFCEECDSIRCPECVLEEVSAYYCPNCLFEVPSASVRAEKNRCARNCFNCPCCSNALAVVPSDSPDPSVAADPLSPQASVGEPPYILSCSACQWDSKVVEITFEKPTGLAAQLQRLEESSSSSNEYEKIREHLEHWLKAGLAAAHVARQSGHKSAHHHSYRPTNVIAAAARALSSSDTTISRDIPSSIASASRFNSLHNLAALHRSSSWRSGPTKHHVASTVSYKDELGPYKSSLHIKTSLAELETNRVSTLKSTNSLESVNRVDQRGCKSINQPLNINDLHPLRISLRSKRTKRCPSCRHIVVKPDTKAASTRFKIRLVASNYLPQIDVHRRIAASLGTRLSAIGASNTAAQAVARRGRVSTSGSSASAVETLVSVGSPHDVTEPLRPGRNFSFQLTFTNPLYEPVEVTAEILEPLDVEEQEDDENAYVIDNQAISGSDKGVSSSKSGDTTFDQWHASMPASTFGINAFAEAWEYEAEDDEDSDIGFDSNSTSASRKYGPGVLAKKANKTVVQLDLAVGREASGHVRIPLYITYTYTAEDPLLLTKQKANKQQETTSSTTQVSASTANPGDVSVNNYDEGVNPNLKTFSFWTSVPLGCVVPRVGLPGGSTLNVTEAQARRAASTSSLR